MSTLPCHWYDDGRGGRYLIPGCHTRVMNPDADECSCPPTARQLAAARRKIPILERKRNGLQTWHDHILRAVHGHPDSAKIMKVAADFASAASPAGTGQR